jgi:hypothetical protein
MAIQSSSRLKISINVDIINNADLQANAQQIVEETRTARTLNTIRNYTPKQKEFIVGYSFLTRWQDPKD